MTQWFQNIIEGPEHVRRRVFWIALFVLVPLILVAWGYSMKLALRAPARTEIAKPLPVAGFQEEVTSGFANIRSLFEGVNRSVPALLQNIGDGNGVPQQLPPPSERSRVHLNVE